MWKYVIIVILNVPIFALSHTFYTQKLKNESTLILYNAQSPPLDFHHSNGLIRQIGIMPVKNILLKVYHWDCDNFYGSWCLRNCREKRQDIHACLSEREQISYVVHNIKNEEIRLLTSRLNQIEYGYSVQKFNKNINDLSMQKQFYVDWKIKLQQLENAAAELKHSEKQIKDLIQKVNQNLKLKSIHGAFSPLQWIESARLQITKKNIQNPMFERFLDELEEMFKDNFDQDQSLNESLNTMFIDFTRLQQFPQSISSIKRYINGQVAVSNDYIMMSQERFNMKQNAIYRLKQDIKKWEDANIHVEFLNWDSELSETKEIKRVKTIFKEWIQ